MEFYERPHIRMKRMYFDSDEILESEYSSATSLEVRNSTVILFDVDESDGVEVLKGTKVKLNNISKSSLKRYAKEQFPEKHVKIIGGVPSRHLASTVTFVALANSFDITRNVLIIPDKTFDELKSARYGYNNFRSDYFYFVLPKDLSTEKHIHGMLKDKIKEREAMILQVHPEDIGHNDDLSFISYKGLNVCYLAYISRKPVLVKISYHKSPLVKEKMYVDCYSTDYVRKVVQLFLKNHTDSHQLQVKLSHKSKLLKEERTIGSYMHYQSDSREMEVMYMIESKRLGVDGINVTAHLVREGHIATVLQKMNGSKSVVFIDKNGSTQDMRMALANIIHKDPASFRILIQGMAVPEVECMRTVPLLDQNSILKISNNSTFMLSCTVSGNNKEAFAIRVYPNLSKSDLCEIISDRLQIDSFLFDLYHQQKPIPEILTEKELCQIDMILIDVKEKRQKVRYFIGASVCSRKLERKGHLVVDESSEIRILDILSFFATSLNVDSLDLRVIESGRCPDVDKKLEDLGISESSILIIVSCPSLLHNDPYLKTQLTGDAEGLLTVTEILMIEGIPVLAHPSFTIASYKERLSKRENDNKGNAAVDFQCNGLRFLRKPSAPVECLPAVHSKAVEENLPSAKPKEEKKCSEQRIAKFQKETLLRKAHKVKEKMTKSDGNYSDRDTASVKDIPNKTTLNTIRQSRSESDLKQGVKSKGRVSFSDIDDTETKENMESAPYDSLSEWQNAIPHHYSANSTNIGGSQDYNFQLLQRETREKLLYKQGQSVMEKETLVRNKVLSSPVVSLQGAGGPVITEISSDEAESSFLQHVASEIGKYWKVVGRNLNIKESDFEDIESSHTSLHERVFQMLQLWRKRNGSQATKNALVEALKQSELLGVAEFITGTSCDQTL